MSRGSAHRNELVIQRLGRHFLIVPSAAFVDMGSLEKYCHGDDEVTVARRRQLRCQRRLGARRDANSLVLACGALPSFVEVIVRP